MANENILYSWLIEKGYNKTQIAKLLKVTTNRLEVVFRHPKTLSCEKLEVLANALDRPIEDVLLAVIYNNVKPIKKHQLWMNE